MGKHCSCKSPDRRLIYGIKHVREEVLPALLAGCRNILADGGYTRTGKAVKESQVHRNGSPAGRSRLMPPVRESVGERRVR